MNSIEINFLGVDCVAYYYTYLDDDDSHIDLDRLEINGQSLDLACLALLVGNKVQDINEFVIQLVEQTIDDFLRD